MHLERASTQCSRCVVGSRRLTSLQIKQQLKMPSWCTGSASRESLIDQLPVDLVDQLPTELWMSIFESIRPNSKELVDFRSHDRDRESKIAALLSDQARFHQLKLVCSRFHQVFLGHPELSAEVILAEGNASNLMPSLSLWLRRFAKFVNTVTSFDISPYQEMVLGGLPCPDSKLAYAHLTGVSSAALHGLAISASMSDLTQLSSLSIELASLQPIHFLLDWVCNITSLVDLEVNVQSACLVSDSLTLLSRLSNLKLSNLTTSDDGRLLIGDVPWLAMQALQRVDLTGPLAFHDGIIQLTTLQHLSFVSFSGLYLLDSATSSLARLTYQLAAHCPRVLVEIDGHCF